ncbi:unnamed protein product [Macrosiphum euphorbiae]|uniref:Uncharacterized protein n=1 Tax=Macrosiphum euphorbiae TaxID=13131 RepID=A0AAV0WAB0_9HEMI|nr:unnamed protein product [Macrosiphum euphorbiae]
MGNDEKIDIPNFNFVASFRRNNRPAGGVAIYQNTATVHYCTNYMDVHAKYATMFNTSTSDIGDMCISRCHCGDNQFIIMVAVYISPNNSLRAIRDFFYENLFIYSHGASALLHQKIGKRFDDLPMILSGDFNINFADDKNLPLFEFFKNEFGLNMSNDRNLSTTRSTKLLLMRSLQEI